MPQTDSPPPPDYVLGLDLGQQADFSALAVLERSWPVGAQRPHFACRHLQRWPLGTAYPRIVASVAALVRTRPLSWPPLVVDQTGVGTAVVDMFRQAQPQARVLPVVITGGHAAHQQDGCWHVPKKELVSTLLAVLGQQRLQIAPLPEREQLVRELLAFRVKVTATAHERFEALHDRDHDDLVLAVALATWLGDRQYPAEAVQVEVAKQRDLYEPRPTAQRWRRRLGTG